VYAPMLPDRSVEALVISHPRSQLPPIIARMFPFLCFGEFSCLQLVNISPKEVALHKDFPVGIWASSSDLEMIAAVEDTISEFSTESSSPPGMEPELIWTFDLFHQALNIDTSNLSEEQVSPNR